MQQHFKKIPISLNGKNFLVEDISLSSEVQLNPKYTYDNRQSKTEAPSSMWNGSCKLSYYLTGFDYLKEYIYSSVDEPISGNIAGLNFNQGYLSNYSLLLEPNNPILINATISFYDKITGILTSTNSINNTGTILRTSDIIINNLSNYTSHPITNFLRINFDYSCNIIPSISYFDTGITPNKVDNIFIQEKIITTEISSDDTNLSVPLSGENFGVLINMANPYNTGFYETFGCSGLISNKSLSVSSNGVHQHTCKIIQHHTNPNGYIYSVITGINNITINFNTGAFPLLSRDSSLNYVDKIFIGDTELTGYSINRTSNYDQISAPIPFNILDDTLTIYTSYGNYVYPNKINFPYNNITITGLSYNTGAIGNNIIISGTNFVRVSDVFFGGYNRGQFQILNPQTIQATIPNNGITNPLIVVSHNRNLSGASPNNFFYQPSILNISPVTGTWKDTIIISGNNLSGTTGVYFGNTIAYSYNIVNNSIINAQSPETGAGYASGYINIYSTGGFTQSYSRYNPTVPIYSFSPLSGIPGNGIVINTKIDTGYLCPFSGGYKVKLGGIDTIFYISGGNSTGALTGTLQLNSNDDYIYIYQPDGITASASNKKFDVIGFPTISYVSPVNVNRYQYFNLLIIGSNFGNFLSSSIISFSGGCSGDYQSYNTGVFLNSYNNNSLFMSNINLTGNSGYYNIFISNLVGSYTLNSGIFLNLPIDQSRQSSATVAIPVNSSYKGSYAIDNSTGTFAAIQQNSATGGYLQLLPSTIPYFDISSILINQSYNYNSAYPEPIQIKFGAPVAYITGLYPPTGSIRFYRNGTSPSNRFLVLDNIIMSGAIIFPDTGVLTGVTRIDIYPNNYHLTTPQIHYLPIIELNIY